MATRAVRGKPSAREWTLCLPRAMSAGLDSSTAAALRTQVVEVLKQSDLTVVSAKKIRTALASKPSGTLPEGLDLVSQKKAVDAVIRECYDDFTSKQAKDAGTNGGLALPGKGGVSGDNGSASTTRGKSKAAPVAKKAAGKKRAASDDAKPKKKRETSANNPLNRPMRLSAPMAEVCEGGEVRGHAYERTADAQMPRHAVVKQLWAYIKKHALQNQDNKRQVRGAALEVADVQILCDDKLRHIFGKDAVEYVHRVALKPVLTRVAARLRWQRYAHSGSPADA